MRTLLFTILLILCEGCNRSTTVDNETLMDNKQKCLIILQRKAMKKLYPEDILKDWANDTKRCGTIADTDSLYNMLMDRAVNAEEGSYGIKANPDPTHEPIILVRTTTK